MRHYRYLWRIDPCASFAAVHESALGTQETRQPHRWRVRLLSCCRLEMIAASSSLHDATRTLHADAVRSPIGARVSRIGGGIWISSLSCSLVSGASRNFSFTPSAMMASIPD